MANESDSEQGCRTQMDEEMINLDKKSDIENLLSKHADECRKRAFADTKTAFNMLRRVFENPVDLDNLVAVSSLSRCAELCKQAAEIRLDFGKNAEEYDPHFEFNGPLEFQDESMDKIIGKDHAKDILGAHLIVQTKFAEIWNGPSVRLMNAFLLYGPRNNGKTHLVCAAIKESKHPYVWVNCDTVNFKWRGKACVLMSLLFEQAKQYEPEPCLIVLDGIDTMTAKRDRPGRGDGSNEKSTALSVTLCSLLKERRLSRNTIVVAITHQPESMDNELCNRFYQKIYVPLPNVAEREQFFKLFISQFPHNITNEVILKLTTKTPRFSGHDIEHTVKEAWDIHLGEIIKNKGKEKDFILQESHLMDAIGKFIPTNSRSTLDDFPVEYGKRDPYEGVIEWTDAGSCHEM